MCVCAGGAYLTHNVQTQTTFTGLLMVHNTDTGAWGTVCDSSFDAYDAAVACRQMGFEGGLPISNVGFSSSTTSSYDIMLSHLECRGTESSLSACGRQRIPGHNCAHSMDAAISCTHMTGGVESIPSHGPGVACMCPFIIPHVVRGVAHPAMNATVIQASLTVVSCLTDT